MIDTVVFDMGQVLIHWYPDMFLDLYDLTQEERADLKRELFTSIEWIQLDRGSITEEAALAAVCPRLPQKLHGIAREIVTHWWGFPFRPMAGMEELVRELKAEGYTLYILSNAGLPLRQYHPLLPGGDCFSGVVVSSEEKVVKPQPEIFRVLLDRYDLTPGNCVFIDDVPVNCEGAVNAGLNAVVFRGDITCLRKELRRMGVRCHE